MEQKIDTGDTVLHHPTGETWLVAGVDGEWISWCGWPEGKGQLSDCVLIDKATKKERLELLNQLKALPESDHRQRLAVRRLAELNSNAPPLAPAAPN